MCLRYKYLTVVFFCLHCDESGTATFRAAGRRHTDSPNLWSKTLWHSKSASYVPVNLLLSAADFYTVFRNVSRPDEGQNVLKYFWNLI